MNRPLDARPDLLLVDDDPLIIDSMRYLLDAPYRLHCATDRVSALRVLREQRLQPALALLDLGLPPCPNLPEEGFALIGELLAHAPQCKIVVLSGQDEASHARHARTLGALEFITKPATPEIVREALASALQLLQRELSVAAQRHALGRLLGESAPMLALRTHLERLARSPFPVLIEGESGSGKELAAHALHELAYPAARPFLALNCAALNPGLIEATLFGHARGAFTGAQAAQSGYFEDAGEGTLFLDEIGELPLDLQPKLLRVLENGEYQRVGETQYRRTRARILAATNRDLQQEVRAGRFRADLFHRLSVLRAQMPPLRHTGSDRHVLREHFTREIAAQLQQVAFDLDSAALEAWQAYDFPGNVRELRNIVIRLMVRYAGRCVSRAELEAEFATDDVPAIAEQPAEDRPATLTAPGVTLGSGVDLAATLRRIERDHIAAALQASRGNMSQAARLLGINRSTLYNRIETLARHGEDFGSLQPPANV